MKVRVCTKSNFRGLNDQLLNVTECRGTRVSCEVDGNTIDFNLNEIVEIYHNTVFTR